MHNCPSCAFGFEPKYSLDFLNYGANHGYDDTFWKFTIKREAFHLSLSDILTSGKYNEFGIKLLIIGYMVKHYFNEKFLCKGCENALKPIMQKMTFKNESDIELLVLKLLSERLRCDIKKSRALNKLK